MFRSIIVIGWKAPASAPETIFIGLDGTEAAAAADAARKTDSFARIVKLTNVSGTPLPVKSAGTVVSKTVPAPAREPFKAPLSQPAKASKPGAKPPPPSAPPAPTAQQPTQPPVLPVEAAAQP